MEDFGYLREEKGHFPLLLKKIFLLGATLFSIACFIYVTIHAYYFVYGDQRNGEIETIKSPEGPIKITEENLALEKIEETGNDSIYDDIFGNKKESLAQAIPKIHLAPEPPMAKKIDPTIIHEGSSIGVDDAKENTKVTDQRIVVYTDTKTDKKGDNASYDLLTKGKVQAKESEAHKKPSNNKASIKVQVAALTSKNAAEEYWKKLNHIDNHLFSGLKLYTETVDLGKRGIFYRVQIGNFVTQTEADEFCKNYVSRTKKSRADCILVE